MILFYLNVLGYFYESCLLLMHLKKCDRESVAKKNHVFSCDLYVHFIILSSYMLGKKKDRPPFFVIRGRGSNQAISKYINALQIS